MLTVDLKSLLLRLNPSCTNVLHAAAGLSVTRTNYEVAVEHFLLKASEEPRSDWALILRRFGLDPGVVQRALEEALEDYRSGNSSKPVFSLASTI